MRVSKLFIAWIDYASTKTGRVFSIFLATAFLGTSAFACDWGTPQKSTELSENGKYEFRITPSKEKSGQPGDCHGALYAKNNNSWKLCWERSLINNVCPIRTLVSNSGKYIVTIGEWSNYEEFPIVIYDAGGRLINAYGKLKQLVPIFSDQNVKGIPLPYSWHGKHLSSTWYGRDWLSHSLFFFEPNDKYLIVRLSTGEVLLFATFDGRLVDDRWKQEERFFHDKDYDELKESLGSLIVLKALKLASSDLKEEKDDGLFVLGQCTDRDSIDTLEQAMKDSTFRIVNTPQGRIREYPIRKAAIEALKARGEKIPDSVIIEEKAE